MSHASMTNALLSDSQIADLGRCGVEAIDDVVRLIDDPSPWVRHSLMVALEVWGPLVADCRDVVQKGLDDDEPFVCFSAMSALANVVTG